MTLDRFTPLPVQPRAFHHFYRTPRQSWWRPLVALLAVLVGFVLIAALAGGVALFIDARTGRQGLEDINAVGVKVTPAFFIANNISLALLIPLSMLIQWAVFRQRPGWLSSLAGRLRWRWLGACLALIAPVYLALHSIVWAVDGLKGLAWGPDTLVMILGILLTTPFQAAGEEYGLRGLVNRSVGGWFSSERLALWLGMALSTALFVLAHGAGDVWLNAFYAVFGALACWLTYRTGGLEAAIALHVVNNMFSLATVPFSDFSGLFDRQAGAGGPAVLVEAPALLIAVGLMLWAAEKRGLPLRTAPAFAPPPVSLGPDD